MLLNVDSLHRLRRMLLASRRERADFLIEPHLPQTPRTYKPISSLNLIYHKRPERTNVRYPLDVRLARQLQEVTMGSERAPSDVRVVLSALNVHPCILKSPSLAPNVELALNVHPCILKSPFLAPHVELALNVHPQANYGFTRPPGSRRLPRLLSSSPFLLLSHHLPSHSCPSYALAFLPQVLPVSLTRCACADPKNNKGGQGMGTSSIFLPTGLPSTRWCRGPSGDLFFLIFLQDAPSAKRRECMSGVRR